MTKLEKLIQAHCPKGIEYKQLSDICTLVTGATPSKVVSDYWHNGSIPWMSSGEVNLKKIYSTEQKITLLGYQKSSTTMVPKHSVVIALAGQGKTRGKVAITEIELCTNQSLCSMICSESIYYKFLYYYLDSKYEELRTISNGDGSRGGLSLKILSPYRIPVPPLEVQREIVRILDTFTELTSELTENLLKELNARQKQYEYYRDKLLSFGENGGGETRSNIEFFLVAEIADTNIGLATTVTKYKANQGVLLIHNSDIQENEIVLKQHEYITEAFAEKNHKKRLQENDVITVHTGDVGTSAVISKEYAGAIGFTTITSRIRNPQKVLPEYFCHYLNSHRCKAEIASMTISDRSNLNQSCFEKLRIPIPPIDEQRRIVTILDHFSTLCTDLTSGLPAEIEARKKQYEYYRDKLLSFTPAD